MKTITILIIIFALFTFTQGISWLLDNPEPDLTSEYSITPYERCMAAYKGSNRESECMYLK